MAAWSRKAAERAASARVGGGSLLGAVEVGHNNGPWSQLDDYQKFNGVLRFSRGDNRDGLSLTGMGFAVDPVSVSPPIG